MGENWVLPFPYTHHTITALLPHNNHSILGSHRTPREEFDNKKLSPKTEVRVLIIFYPILSIYACEQNYNK
jgi:hypothetical protein